MDFEDLKTPEFQEKLKNAQNPQELLELAKEGASSSPTSNSRPLPVASLTGAAGRKGSA